MVVWAAAIPALKAGASAIATKIAGSKLGSFLKDNSGSILQGGSSLMGLFGGNSAKKSFEYSMALQQHQYDLERKSRQTAYQDTRQSLEAAGYNPLLAVGQQSGSLPVGNQMNVTDPATEKLQNSIALANAIADIKLKKAQEKNIKTDTDLKPYDKPLKVIGDLLQGRNSKVANSAKNVIGTLAGIDTTPGASTNSANSAYQQFRSSHPTVIRALKKIKNRDFRGAGYEIGARLGQRYKNRSSARSSQKSGRPDWIPASDWYDGEPVRGRW